MEVGRGSAGSSNDFRERRRKTKKKLGSLPLGIFLSFNDRGVHPKCPNASNSYHKCGRHCLDKIPPELDQDREKKLEKEGVNPNCPNASNPYHKCAEYCFDKLQDRPAMRPKEEKKAGLTTDRLVKSKCKFASNPYHVCTEYCLESVPRRDQPERTARLRSSSEVKKAPMKKERTTGSPPPCKHKSIPHHECTEICLQSASNGNLAERGKPNGESVKSDKRSAHLNRSASIPFHTVTEYCLEDTLEKEHPKRDDSKGVSTKADKNSVRHSLDHASSSFHKVNEYFFQDTPEKDHYNGAIKPKEESDIIATVKSRVNLEGKTASNTSHESTRFCVESIPDTKITVGDMKPKDENISFMAQFGANYERKNASSPSHARAEDSLHNLPAKGQSGEGILKSKEDKVFVPLERGLSSRCINASNPHHVCAEYCLHDVPRGRSKTSSASMKAKEEKKVFSSLPRVNSECKNASNPYHKCAEFCNENVLERDQPRKTFMKSKAKEIVDFPAAGEVNPDCKFASNPYHVCAEYCFQNAPEREKRRQDIKLKGLKELKNLVSNKKITSGQPQCNFASNPYHKCAEYCVNGYKPDGVMKTNERTKDSNYSPRRGVDPSRKHASKNNEEVEGIKAAFKEKKRDSLKANKRDQLIMEKKSSAGSNLQDDGMKRSSAESKHADASSPINNNYDLRDKTKDLQSAKVAAAKNLKEPTDVQLVDSSDILHEWAKYCSQKGADDVGTPVQEEIGNGEGEVFLKDYASENLKVQTNGGLACSLPISLLYFLGFLFSVVCWIQMIHSFIMSPEKIEGGERMKAEGDGDHECRNVSDPYRICADVCFRGSGE